MMHWIQKHILRELTLHVSRRFGQLRPKQVESNLFIYHLKNLMREGYVQKSETGDYSLAPAGKSYVDRISLEKFNPRIQPKIVTLLIIRNKKGELLLWKRGKQPFLGNVGFPVGKIHLGEKLADAADRELREKAGLKTRLTHIGDGYVSVYEGEELVSHILFHCFEGNNPTGELLSSSGVFWGELKDQKRLVPGTKEVLEASLKAKGHFFVEVEKKKP